MTAAADLTVGRTVDWGFAATVGQWLARPGPPSTDYTRRQVIDNLATAAKAAEPPVRDVTGLHTDGVGARGPHRRPARLDPGGRRVDAGDDRRNRQAARRDQRTGHRRADRCRAGVRRHRGSSASTTRSTTAVPAAGLPERHCGGTAIAGGAVRFPVVGVPARGHPPGAVHRQSVAVRLHVAGAGCADQESGDDVRRWWAGWPNSPAAAATRRPTTRIRQASSGLLRAVQSEPQREALDQLLVLGTLLEGHADHVMDAVGPVVVPSVATIRARFDERRQPQAATAATAAARVTGHRRQTEPVHPGQGVRRPRGGPRRDGAVQHRLDESGHPAPADRDRIPATMDRPGAVAELRAAVAAFATEYLATADRWCVALSGGPDSLALTAVAASLLPTTALIVDHGLQADSAAVAATAQRQAEELGCVDAQVLCVQVGADGGPEARRAHARYRALAGCSSRPAGAAGPHPRRSGRDRVARAGPRFGCPIDRRDAALRPALVSAVAGRAAQRDACRVRGAGPERLARPAQLRPPIHPHPAAP